MRKIHFILLVCAVLLTGTFAHPAWCDEKIVAIVNNEVITQRDLDDFLNFMRMQLARQYDQATVEKKVSEIKLDLIAKLIDDRLILQEANKENQKIDDNRIKAKLADIKSKYASEKEFEDDLAKQGLTQGDIEKKVKEQLLMYYIVQNKVRNKISIRPEEVTAYYDKNLQDFTAPEKRSYSTYSLENEDLAKTFAFNLRNGEKLEDLAARYPVKTGTLEVGAKGELKPEIEDALAKLSAGQVSVPVKAGDKYLVFKLENITPSKQQPLNDAKEQIRAALYEKKMQEELSKWLDELRKQSYIKIFQS